MNEFPNKDIPSNQMECFQTHLSDEGVVDDINFRARGLRFYNKLNYHSINQALMLQSVFEGDHYYADTPKQPEAFYHGFAVFESISELASGQQSEDHATVESRLRKLSMMHIPATLADESIDWRYSMPNANQLVQESGVHEGFFLPSHDKSLAMGAAAARLVWLFSAAKDPSYLLQ